MTDNTFDLSIIIPVYNCADYLNKGIVELEPLFASNLLFEIIYINDGSTDNSLNVLSSIQASYKNVKVITQKNKGLSGARNVGILNACGKYLMFLDSDDWVNSIEIEELIIFVLKNDLDALGFRLRNHYEFDNSTDLRAKHPIEYNHIDTGECFLNNGYQPSSACLFLLRRKNILTNELFFIEGIMHEDVEFTTRLMIHSKRVLFSEVVVYNYLRHGRSMTINSKPEHLMKYLSHSIIVAELVKDNLGIINFKNRELINTIMKNSNSIIWNLLWRFVTNPKEVPLNFKLQCIEELKQKKLYPIKGPLKTNFQRLTCLFFNNSYVFATFIKVRS